MKASAVKITVLLAVYLAHNTKGLLTVYPLVGVQAESVLASFSCSIALHDEQVLSSLYSINWRVNGATLIQNPRPNITVQVDLHSSNTNNLSVFQSMLTILALPEYNGTVAQCVVYPPRNESDSVTLIVQGPLQSVSNLHFVMETGTNTSIHISWTAPFSLNLTTAEPDIQYCVDVYNVTGGGDLVESRCDITETLYTYTPDNPSPDHVFNFAVTPRSNVEGALNGTTSEPVQGYVIQRPVAIPSDVISYQVNSRLSPITWQFPTGVIGSAPGQIAVEYSVHLLSADDPDRPSDCSCSATSEVVNDDTIQLTLQWCPGCEIQRHRVYRFTIDATNSAGTFTSDPVELSTHDVQNFTVTYLLHNHGNYSEINITWSYLSKSSPNGLFAIIHSLKNPNEVHYVVVNGQGKTNAHVRIEGISQEQYSILVYDLEESLLPELWPAGVRIVNINSSQNASVSEPKLKNSVSGLRPPPTVECQGNGLLCVNCSFSEPSMNACVVILRSTHNTNNPLGKKLIVHSIERSIAYDCVDVSEDEYHVAVFGLLTTGLERVPVFKSTVQSYGITTDPNTTGNTTVPSTNSDPTIIAVITVSVFLTLVLCTSVAIILIACFVWRSKCATKSDQEPCEINTSIEMTNEMTLPGIEQPNEAYNIVKIFNRNKAYSTVQLQSTRLPSTAQSVTATHRDGNHREPKPPVVAADYTSPIHIYDEPILLPASGCRQTTEVIYTEIPTNRE